MTNFEWVKTLSIEEMAEVLMYPYRHIPYTKNNKGGFVGWLNKEHKEVKYCPFCGGNDISIRNPESRKYYMQCACGARGRQEENEDDAIDAWNERADTSKLKKLKELELKDSYNDFPESMGR